MTGIDGDIDKVQAAVVAREPVLAGFVATAIVGAVSTWLVAHGLTNASTDVQVAEPAITAVVLVGVGFIVRQFVTPMFAFVKHHVPEHEATEDTPAPPAI